VCGGREGGEMELYISSSSSILAVSHFKGEREGGGDLCVAQHQRSR
jgi:hypothetical protein